MNYKDLTKLIKNKKNEVIMPDVAGSIDSFNHALGTGSIPGTGMAMAEDIRNDIPVNDDIFLAVQNQFPVTDFPEHGASYILPDGKFLRVARAHGEVDEFIVDNFPEINLEDYPNTYLVDSVHCIRVNDGRGNSFGSDRYITLPTYITSDQIYALEDWLKAYDGDQITVSDTKDRMVVFDLTDGITRIINRIKKYKNTNILSEEKMRKTYSELNEEELPDVHEDNIISDEDAGISSLFIDAINSCWATIDDYNSMIVTLDSLGRHEFDDVLRDLVEQRNHEAGALQGLLELLSPASEQIEQGKDEAQDQVAFDEVHEDFNLNETMIKEDDERQAYIDAGLDPDIDRTPGSRPDGSYYDSRGFHWDSTGHLIAETNSAGEVIVPKEWEEWWT